jgi:NTP pyrophosphatase (non-canonical NTP hydrolase)
MRRIYFARDAERGAEGTYRWFKEEVEELGDAMRKSDREALENEFADVVAWLASLANVLQVNLEKAVLRKYDNHCPKCSSSPCECTFRREEAKQSSAAAGPRQ